MPKIQAPVTAFAGFRQLPGGGFSFTMVPNQFLDEIVPIEKPCVVKVVCLVLRRTLGWVDQTGQRRQQNQVAYSEFAREMNMSTQAVADGLKIALEKGYIVRVKAGTMRDATSGNPEAASYSLRWMSPLQPASVPTPSYNNETNNKISSAPESLVETEQENDSENQMVLSSLINRDMINKADSEKINKVELKPSSKISECKKPRNFSNYIGNLITDIGEQFGDGEHRLSNIKQALNCWEKSGLAEKEFVQVLYRARTLTRQHTSSRKKFSPAEKPIWPQAFGSWITLAGEPSRAEISRAEISGAEKNSLSSTRNRMPYFFKVLQDLIQQPTTEQSLEIPVEDHKISNSSIATPKQAGLHNKKGYSSTNQEGEANQTQGQLVALAPHEAMIPPEEAGNLAVETAPVEIPSELVRLAGNFASETGSVQVAWQRWEASLQNPHLKALVRRVIFLEKPQVRPELHPFLFPPENHRQQDFSKKILLVFRNAFDTRYATSYIDDIAFSLERIFGASIRLTITHG